MMISLFIIQLLRSLINLSLMPHSLKNLFSFIVNKSNFKSDTDAEQEKFELAQDQMETSDEDRVIEEGPENCDEQRGINDRLPDRSEDGVAVHKSMARGGTSKNSTDAQSAVQFQQREIIAKDAVDLMDQQHAEELSIDSDGYLNEEIDVSMTKEFLVSHCTSRSDSLENLMYIEQNVCLKCKEGGQLFVCHTCKCPLVIQENCVDSLASFSENGNFFCSICEYSILFRNILKPRRRQLMQGRT